MMAFFRNKEMKRFATVLSILTILGSAAGFMINFVSGLLIFVLCTALCILFFIFTRRRYNALAELCEQIDLVLHGQQALNIGLYTEGELSILRSEIHKMTVRLREQADQLRQDKLSLSNSMADITHQLRTPMTSIHMIVSFLGEAQLPSERRLELVSELRTLLLRIDWLVTTLLKLSKLDAGTVVFQSDRIAVAALLERAMEPFLIPLELHDISVEVHGDAHCYFTGDLPWSAEALGNIIKNCMEHCEDGGAIHIDYSQNALFTQIEISDSGEGISPEDLPHIFERFYQGKHARELNFGIGLALCRTILSFQNATIKASNNAQGGACFTIKFYHQVI